MESILMIAGAVLLTLGFAGGWYCYARVSAETIDEASYQVAHGLLPDNSLFLIGAIVGLVAMVSGMVMLFTALVGVSKIMVWVNWFQEIFG